MEEQVIARSRYPVVHRAIAILNVVLYFAVPAFKGWPRAWEWEWWGYFACLWVVVYFVLLAFRERVDFLERGFRRRDWLGRWTSFSYGEIQEVVRTYRDVGVITKSRGYVEVEWRLPGTPSRVEGLLRRRMRF